MSSSNFKQKRISKETKGLNNICAEKYLTNIDKFLMSFSKRLSNYNYHAKGLSLREILMERPCQTFIINYIRKKVSS